VERTQPFASLTTVMDWEGEPYCDEVPDHLEMVEALSRAFELGDTAGAVVRSLPDPGAWVCIGTVFARWFECGCLVRVGFRA